MLDAAGALCEDGKEVAEAVGGAGRRGPGGRGAEPAVESRRAGRGAVGGKTGPVAGGDGRDAVETALELGEIDKDAFAGVDVAAEPRQESVHVRFELERDRGSDRGGCGVATESADETCEVGVLGSAAQLLQLLDDIVGGRQHRSHVVVDARMEGFDREVDRAAGRPVAPELGQEISTSVGIVRDGSQVGAEVGHGPLHAEEEFGKRMHDGEVLDHAAEILAGGNKGLGEVERYRRERGRGRCAT